MFVGKNSSEHSKANLGRCQTSMIKLLVDNYLRKKLDHRRCVKPIRIWSFSGPYSV